MKLTTQPFSWYGNQKTRGRSLLLKIKITRRLLALSRSWRAEQKLRKSGCINWEHYRRQYDVDHNYRASRIKDYFHGYPYIYVFENHNHDIYYWDIGYAGINTVEQWCSKNLKGKFRFDFLRVIQNYHGEWEINEIGGGDYIFAAFKDERDYLMFTLRWS